MEKGQQFPSTNRFPQQQKPITGVDRQRTPPQVSRVRYLCHILPCLIPRVRVKSEAQPKGTKQPNVLGAHRYCLDEKVWLSSLHNPSVYIYNSFRLSSLAQAVWK